jgi:hypothetical protein
MIGGGNVVSSMHGFVVADNFAEFNTDGGYTRDRDTRMSNLSTMLQVCSISVDHKLHSPMPARLRTVHLLLPRHQPRQVIIRTAVPPPFRCHTPSRVLLLSTPIHHTECDGLGRIWSRVSLQAGTQLLELGRARKMHQRRDPFRFGEYYWHRG